MADWKIVEDFGSIPFTYSLGLIGIGLGGSNYYMLYCPSVTTSLLKFAFFVSSLSFLFALTCCDRLRSYLLNSI
jgi:hypothetical protein